MKKYIKAFFSLFAGLLAIELGLSYYVASLTEAKFKAMQALLTENQLVASKVTEYRRGLFKSEAETLVQIKNLKPEKSIRIKHSILNGPIIFNKAKRNPFEFKLARIKSVPINMPPEIQMAFVANTLLHYNGDIESSTIGSIYKSQRPAFQISTSYWSENYFITNHLKRVKAVIFCPELLVQAMGMNFLIKGIEIHFDQSEAVFGNWVGNFSIV